LIKRGGTAAEALWLLWQGSDWPARLRKDSAFGGDHGRRANRDLDAVCALFDIAARSEEVAGLRGVTGFLAEMEGQQIPADTLRESEVRGWRWLVIAKRARAETDWSRARRPGGVWPVSDGAGSLLEPDGWDPAAVRDLPTAADRGGATTVLASHPRPPALS
jgi:hypothetical protein